MLPLESISAKPGARWPGSTANSAEAHNRTAEKMRIVFKLARTAGGERLQRFLVRRARDAPLGDDRGDVPRGRHVERGVLDRRPFGRHRMSEDVRDLRRRALFDR